MKLTANNKDLERVDEVLVCPKVATYCGLSTFLEAHDSQLYKFSTLSQAQLTTQVLLYKMMQQLDMTEKSEEGDLEEESDEEENYDYDYEPILDEEDETYENDLQQASD